MSNFITAVTTDALCHRKAETTKWLKAHRYDHHNHTEKLTDLKEINNELKRRADEKMCVYIG
jgi:hypothetical protein